MRLGNCGQAGISGVLSNINSVPIAMSVWGKLPIVVARQRGSNKGCDVFVSFILQVFSQFGIGLTKIFSTLQNLSLYCDGWPGSCSLFMSQGQSPHRRGQTIRENAHSAQNEVRFPRDIADLTYYRTNHRKIKKKWHDYSRFFGSNGSILANKSGTSLLVVFQSSSESTASYA